MPLFLLTRGVGMGGSAVAPDPCDAGGEAEPTNPRGTTLGLPRLRGDGKETDWSSLRRAMGILSGYSWPVVDRSGTNELTTVITTDNIESVGLPVVDTTSLVKGSVDATKEVRIEADGLSTGVTRVITMPDWDFTLSTPSIADGSEGSPSLHFQSDTDNGIYRFADNTWFLVSAGTETLKIKDGNTVELSSGVSMQHETSGAIIVDTDGNLRFRVYTDATRPAAGTAGLVIYNSDDGNLNIDTGSGWILPDGTAT